MPFATYADLTASVTTWLRNDELAANIADYIVLFEAWLATRLQIREQETTVSLTTSAGSVTLPADYLTWRQLVWVGQPNANLKYRTPSGLTALHPTSVAGIPADFTIQASTILIRDTDDTANGFTFDYFARTAALSSALNAIYTKYPHLYLYGTLTEAYGLNRDNDQMGVWIQRRDSAFDAIDRLDKKTRAFGPITIAGPTP